MWVILPGETESLRAASAAETVSPSTMYPSSVEKATIMESPPSAGSMKSDSGTARPSFTSAAT